jgi:hypothetical protein
VHPQILFMIILNVVGGIAVLASYAHGLLTHPGAGGALWGGVPASLQPLYTVSMLLAAIGYFPFTAFLLLQVDPQQARIGGRLGYGWFNVFYALVLIPSALWLPLTFMLIDRWSPLLWLTIRVVLGLVALGSLALLLGLVTLAPPGGGLLRRLAIAGAVAFCVQTVILDALVWPAYFPVKSEKIVASLMVDTFPAALGPRSQQRSGDGEFPNQAARSRPGGAHRAIGFQVHGQHEGFPAGGDDHLDMGRPRPVLRLLGYLAVGHQYRHDDRDLPDGVSDPAHPRQGIPGDAAEVERVDCGAQRAEQPAGRHRKSK